jgi:hypothetical protein
MWGEQCAQGAEFAGKTVTIDCYSKKFDRGPAGATRQFYSFIIQKLILLHTCTSLRLGR